MRILALDSTALSGSVALCNDRSLVAEYSVNTGNTHSQTLLPMVESVLALAGWSVGDIDLFACTVGPGSFTGVRIGVATVKGLAFGRGKPCVGVSTLESLAYNGMMLEGLLCPCMNARRGQVYNGLFAVRDGKLMRLCPDRALPLTDLTKELAESPALSDRPVWLMGDGATMAYDAMTAHQRAGGTSLSPECVRCLPERLLWQSGYSTAQVALDAYLSGDYTTDAALTPVYLRMSQAERTRQEKLSLAQPAAGVSDGASARPE
jgi:tRNA threonylcarbamoyladenosine biosynthesis protein TsaB